MENRFLAQFMQRQMNFVHDVAAKPEKSKHGTASGKPAFGEDEGSKTKMMELLRKKKSKKFVLDFYRERISELCKDGY